MLAWPGHAKNKKSKTPPPAPKDEIQVVGHIPLIDGPVRRFLAAQHYSSYYLYAEHEADGKAVFLVAAALKFQRPRLVVFLNFWFAAIVTWNLGMILIMEVGRR